MKEIEMSSGPQWSQNDEYTGFDSVEFQEDLKRLRSGIDELKAQSALLDSVLLRANHLSGEEVELVEAVCRQRRLADEIFVIGANLGTFVNCQLSVNGGHVLARQLQATLRQHMTALEENSVALEQLMIKAHPAFIDACLERNEFHAHRFLVSKERELLPFQLNLDQEKLLTRCAVNGLHGWGTLYDNISTSLQCSIDLSGSQQTLGLARAAGYAQSPRINERQVAYRAVNAAWRTQQESCASILNALAGWRLDENQMRSHTKPLHFLDRSLHACRIDRLTLDTMMSVVDQSQAVARKALKIKAQTLGLERLGPWDLFAPLPEEGEGTAQESIPFAEAIELIRMAFADVSSEMADFVGIMEKNRWIEGRVSDTKRPGAYCTRFAKSRNPRVYMTYKGSLDDVSTLAHELGHAFHNWVMRDLPLPETWYPMTLAETASIFAETVVSDVLLKTAETTTAKRRILWGELGSAEAFLMNIPARYRFECELYKARADRTLSPSELSDLMVGAWQKSYGDTLAEMNELFWCSKLHFHMSSTSFYNYPYTFGYLFALGVYAQREKLGPRFFDAYVQLLRDTGRMSAEDLAWKHLNVDLRQPQFWLDSIAMIDRQIEQFVGLS